MADFFALCALVFLSATLWLLIAERPKKVSPRSLRIGFKFEAMKVVMNLKVSQQLPVKIVAEDEFGNPTGTFASPPAWSLTDSSLGSVSASDDGLSATVTPSGKLGSCQLQVSGTADGKTIVGSLDLALIPGDATQLVLQPGAPSDAPASQAAPSA